MEIKYRIDDMVFAYSKEVVDEGDVGQQAMSRSKRKEKERKEKKESSIRYMAWSSPSAGTILTKTLLEQR